MVRQSFVYVVSPSSANDTWHSVMRARTLEFAIPEAEPASPTVARGDMSASASEILEIVFSQTARTHKPQAQTLVCGPALVLKRGSVNESRVLISALKVQEEVLVLEAPVNLALNDSLEARRNRFEGETVYLETQKVVQDYVEVPCPRNSSGSKPQ